MRFATELVITGPMRAPAQMLADQVVDDHASVHEGETAAALGLTGAPIEGPTHFSQFDPLAHALWGDAWFESGCISCHFQNMVIEGEEVQASVTTTGASSGRIEAHKADGSPVLTGTASIGPDHPETELEVRRAKRGDPGRALRDRPARGGLRSTGDERVTHGFDQPNGALYPFSLEDKLARITEPHPWYTAEGASSAPWGRAVAPMEMISVLAHKSGPRWPVRSPAIGLFLDMEIRLLAGPVFVGSGIRPSSARSSASARAGAPSRTGPRQC